MAIRRENRKLKKHKVLMRSKKLRPYLPDTQSFTENHTMKMLQKYPTIFIKPNLGRSGAGIIRVHRIAESFEVSFKNKNSIVDEDKVFETILSHTKPSKKYIVQKGIDLGSYKGALFDVRIYLQKPANKWLYSGHVARVAAPHKFITNYHKGGHAEPLKKVLLSLFSKKQSKVKKCLSEIKEVANMIAQKMDQRFPGIRTLGLDIAIEKSGRIWIIEVNTGPAHFLFKQLADKRMLRKILKNKRIIKRKYA